MTHLNIKRKKIEEKIIDEDSSPLDLNKPLPLSLSTLQSRLSW